MRLAVLLLTALLFAAPTAEAAATVELVRHMQHPDGRCEFVIAMVFPDGTPNEIGMIFATCDDARSFVGVLEATEENLIRFVLAYWMARDPDFSNPNLVVGKQLTIDFAAANPIKLQ